LGDVLVLSGLLVNGMDVLRGEGEALTDVFGLRKSEPEGDGSPPWSNMLAPPPMCGERLERAAAAAMLGEEGLELEEDGNAFIDICRAT
jgi:hypothetical protein